MAAEITAGLLPLDIILQESRGYSYAKWLGQYNFSESQGNGEKYENLGNISSEFLSLNELLDIKSTMRRLRVKQIQM
jgi:hypothetical protein